MPHGMICPLSKSYVAAQGGRKVSFICRPQCNLNVPAPFLKPGINYVVCQQEHFRGGISPPLDLLLDEVDLEDFTCGSSDSSVNSVITWSRSLLNGRENDRRSIGNRFETRWAILYFCFSIMFLLYFRFGFGIQIQALKPNIRRSME
ncbi:hypothetical protein YC2023_016848 [Brassica napus]